MYILRPWHQYEHCVVSSASDNDEYDQLETIAWVRGNTVVALGQTYLESGASTSCLD